MEQKLKGFGFLLLTLVLAVVLAACGDDEDGANGEEGEWTGTITIWDGPRWAQAGDTSGEDGEGNKYFWIEEKIEEFEAEHPGVEIELVQVPWAELPDKLGVNIAGGS